MEIWAKGSKSNPRQHFRAQISKELKRLLIASLVYTAEDAELAILHGFNGIVVSNHGGRQLDGVPATLDALREIVPVAKGKVPIVVDGGIRRGSDIFKALAIGADFCMAGRPALWGLAVSSTTPPSISFPVLYSVQC